MTPRQIAEFQMEQYRLCMPIDVFMKALSDTLGRPVYTHELGLNREGLMKELRGEKEPTALEEIINLIPEDKRIVIHI